jgi:hypothetical protein
VTLPHARYWLRLDHAGLGMPVPAVYVPLQHLPPALQLKRRFVDVVHRDEGADLPIVAGLAADIGDPGGMQLYAVQHGPKQDPGALIVTATSATEVASGHYTEVASGHYTEPAPRAWREEAYAARMIILVLGRPSVDRETVTPFELLFTKGSRIGVVPLVAPAPQ